MNPDFKFTDFLNRMRECDRNSWITVHKREQEDERYVQIHCALVPTEQIPEVLLKTTGELRIEQGLPGYILYPSTGKPPRYCRYGGDNGVEPLVILRSFIGDGPEYLEISEEFRHFFNLSRSQDNSNLIAFGESGEPIDVVRMTGDSEVRIKLKYLKTYLAAKGMTLSLFFLNENTYDGLLETYGVEEFRNATTEDDFTYSISAMNDIDWNDRQTCFSQCEGKKLIHGDPDFDPRNPDGPREPSLSFIIGVDENGKTIEFSSDKDGLANNFGKNRGAPNYMTRVFFSREVLKRYYDDPRYTVEAGVLRCNGVWYLRIDNDSVNDVNVSLGDLGDLPIDHQNHWRAYNIVPEGKMSQSAYGREVLGEFTKSEHPVFTFKSQFNKFQTSWHESLGWHLFLPLTAKDLHLYNGLHVPLPGNQNDLDIQVQALTKLLVDSINVAEIKKLGIAAEGSKSIHMLEELLKAHGHSGYEEHIGFLRKLQGIRSSGSAHRKGREYELAMKKINPDELSNDRLFISLLGSASSTLEYLERLLDTIAEKT